MAKPTQSPAPVDPGTLVEQVRRWAHPLLDNLGSGFVSLYLYGSGADGSFRPGKSDLNLFLVTRSLSAAGLRSLAKAWPGDRADGNRINLVLLSEDQIPRGLPGERQVVLAAGDAHESDVATEHRRVASDVIDVEDGVGVVDIV